MEHINKKERSQLWNNIYEVLARLDLKEVEGDCLDRSSAATEIEEVVNNSSPIQNVGELIIAWEEFKKSNWWESDSIDVEKVLIDKFQSINGF
jgi:hypothetical protein